MVWLAASAGDASPASRCCTATGAAYMNVAQSAAAATLGSDTQADELFEIARLDFEKVFTRRQSGEREVDVLHVGRGRRSHLKRAHRLTAPVQQLRRDRGRDAARPVRGHANQQPVSPGKFTGREGGGVGIVLELL